MWVSPSLEDGKAALYRKLRFGRPVKSVWLIALSEDGTHLVDIYPSKNLQQRYYRRSKQIVIGLASAKEEAEEMSGSILYEVYRRTGGFDLMGLLQSGKDG